jgi:CRP/FNR family transcriptional regulator
MDDLVNQCLGKLGNELVSKITTKGKLRVFQPGEAIVKTGQVVRYLPIVLNGAVKIFSEEKTAHFHLYYINPGEPCVFSFAHLFSLEPQSFSALAETESTLILLDVKTAEELFDNHPSFSRMIVAAYQKHYNQLLSTIIGLSSDRLEERILNFLIQKITITRKNPITISQPEIASDMGTSREVVSRLLKKLEENKKIVREGKKIKVL